MRSRSTPPRRTCSSSPCIGTYFFVRSARTAPHHPPHNSPARRRRESRRSGTGETRAGTRRPADPPSAVRCRRSDRPRPGSRCPPAVPSADIFRPLNPATTPRPSAPEKWAIRRPRRVNCRCLSSRPSRFQSQISVGLGSSCRHSARWGTRDAERRGIVHAADQPRAAGVGAQAARQGPGDLLRRFDPERNEVAGEDRALKIGARGLMSVPARRARAAAAATAAAPRGAGAPRGPGRVAANVPSPTRTPGRRARDAPRGRTFLKWRVSFMRNAGGGEARSSPAPTAARSRFPR